MEEAGNVRSSPIVWAAVMTLSDFLATQERSAEVVPSDVLEAIRRLTLFIREEEPVREEEELKSMQAITQFTRRRQQEEDTVRQQITRPTTRPPTERKSFRFNPSLSSTKQTTRETTKVTSIPRRPSFLPTRKPAVVKSDPEKF